MYHGRLPVPATLATGSDCCAWATRGLQLATRVITQASMLWNGIYNLTRTCCVCAATYGLKHYLCLCSRAVSATCARSGSHSVTVRRWWVVGGRWAAGCACLRLLSARGVRAGFWQRTGSKMWPRGREMVLRESKWQVSFHSNAAPGQLSQAQVDSISSIRSRHLGLIR